MSQPSSLTTALAVVWSMLSLASAQLDHESDVHPSASMLSRRNDKKTSTRISQAFSQEHHGESYSRDPLREKHNFNRKLTSNACSGNNMMCGCNDIRQSDYRGRYHVTQGGFQCKEWSVAANYPNQGLDDGPYCRNPNGVASRAWCFVENANVLWDYCNVPMCSNESPSSAGPSDITPGCINTARYDAIYKDIEAIKNSIGNDVDRSHFL
ncbi:hypothetical protein ACHAW6_000898, partial [Cyclotella cf. meneghiniana]